MDVDELTALLADRLAAIVPAGFHVQAADGMLWYSADEGRFPGQQGDYRVGRAGTHVRDNLGAYGETDADNLTGVAVQALDELQDHISEATHDPWPGARAQPRPYARIRDAMLHLGYGDPDAPILACAPIPLAALNRPG
ncbi:MAG: hypothetical protein ACRDOA_08295 [Streptosporangiaceae bacterium]